MRLAESLGELRRLESAAVECPRVQDQRCIAVGHVLPGAPAVVRRFRFAQLVLRGKDAVFCRPAARAPAAVGNTVTDCPVEGGAIRSRLTAGDNAGNELGAGLWHGSVSIAVGIVAS